MFQNYFNTAVRNLFRNRMYSFINILGLTIGLTACLLVATVVLNDLSYDRQWTRSKDIYRIVSMNSRMKNIERFGQSLTGLGPALKKNFPEVQDYCRMQVTETRMRIGNEKEGVAMHCLSADTSIWRMLDFIAISGNPQKFISGYSNLVITESLAKQYFPHTDPVGKTIENIPDMGKSQTYLITGIIKDIPANSYLYARALILKKPAQGEDELNKAGFGTLLPQYLLLAKGTNLPAFTKKANAWYRNFLGKNDQFILSFQLQPISNIHLYPGFANDPDKSGSIRSVYIFSAVAILLLLIACINFMTLTMARVLKRVKETGIRKVLGAGKKELVTQFLCESLIFFFISFAFSLIFYSIFIKEVEKFIGHPLALSLISHTSLLAAVGGIILLISLFTSLYPALFLSRPAITGILRGDLSKNINAGFLKKALVTWQFVLAIGLIVAMMVVRSQVYFLNHKDLGFDKDNLLKIDMNAWGQYGPSFKQQVLKLPGVEHASITGWTPDAGGGNMTTEIALPSDTTQKIKAWYIVGDVDLATTLKLTLEKGRLFNPLLSTDMLNDDSLMRTGFEKYEALNKLRPVLITSYTANFLRIKKLNQPCPGIQGIPVGIVKNFNNESLHETLKPCIIEAGVSPGYGEMLIRVNPHAAKQVLQQLNILWQKFYPDRLLQTGWISDLLADQYKTEKKLEQLFAFFGLLSIFLACMGLFGLITFTAEQRTKEIGIRKVLGASVAVIVALLSKDFLKLVLIAILIASPIAWWAMNKWLQNFAYRIHISWWIFAGAGLLTILIALITVSFQSIKAAIANPVQSLRTE
ncbi:MAG TPA: FtsX-like permease family protein [Chitinophagaceae bacterium]